MLRAVKPVAAIHYPELAVAVWQIDLVDVESSTILAFKYIYDSAELLKGEESRQAFVRFVELISSAHPVDRCASDCEGRGTVMVIPCMFDDLSMDDLSMVTVVQTCMCACACMRG